MCCAVCEGAVVRARIMQAPGMAGLPPPNRSPGYVNAPRPEATHNNKLCSWLHVIPQDISKNHLQSLTIHWGRYWAGANMNMNMHPCPMGLQPPLRNLFTIKYQPGHQHGMQACHVHGTYRRCCMLRHSVSDDHYMCLYITGQYMSI